MKPVELPQLETISIQLPQRRLSIQQAAGLTELVERGVRNQDEPFWACVWPSARALVELLADFDSLRGKRVLELGCGPGAPGLVAAAIGASVTLTDIRPEACALSRLNAEANDLSVECTVMDWNSPPADLGCFDGILAADVLYGDGMLRGVLRFLKAHLAPDGIALLTDPNRIQPGGVQGAARLAGLEVESLTLKPGRTLQGGVTLHRLQRRASMLGARP